MRLAVCVAACAASVLCTAIVLYAATALLPRPVAEFIPPLPHARWGRSDDASAAVIPFSVSVSDADLADLRARLDRPRRLTALAGNEHGWR
jgi:hypothetical protein